MATLSKSQNRRGWKRAAHILLLLALLFVVTPRVLIAVARNELDESSCGDANFRLALGILDFAAWSPFSRGEARDIGSHATASRCTPVFQACAELRAQVKAREQSGYRSKVDALYAKYDAELHAAETMDAKKLILARRDAERATITAPSLADGWTSHMLPDERRALCAQSDLRKRG